MFRKDFLEKQLETLGLAISELIGDFLNPNQEGTSGKETKEVNEVLEREFGIDLEEIRTLEPEKLIGHLANTKKLKTGKINLLADLLFATAQFYENSEKPGFAKDLYLKTQLLYEYVDKEEKTFSEARQQKINTIKDKNYESE